MTVNQQTDAIDLAADSQRDKYLTFMLDSENYGVEIKYVTEIIGIQPTTVVPDMPDYICGIINLRGKIIPVMDVRLKFDKEFLEYTDRTCVIVIDVKDITMGLIVDSMSDVLTIPKQDIAAPPELSKNDHKYIQGIGKVDNRVTLILDCQKLLSNDENIDSMGE